MNSIVFATVHNYDAHSIVRHAATNYVAVRLGNPVWLFRLRNEYLENSGNQGSPPTTSDQKLVFHGGETYSGKGFAPKYSVCQGGTQCRHRLGHTNGSKIPLPYLDGANVWP